MEFLSGRSITALTLLSASGCGGTLLPWPRASLPEDSANAAALYVVSN